MRERERGRRTHRKSETQRLRLRQMHTQKITERHINTETETEVERHTETETDADRQTISPPILSLSLLHKRKRKQRYGNHDDADDYATTIKSRL